MTAPLPTPKDHEAPGPFQFGLRTLFYATAFFGALFAVMSVVGAVWSTILVWFLILALGHVIGNAWGSQRWRRHDPAEVERDLGAEPGLVCGSAPPAAPATRLRESTRLGWRMAAATIAGAVLAGGLGAGSLACLGSEKVGSIAIVVGAVSSAVLGGLFGFLASSFLEVAGLAWREAASGRPAQQAPEQGKEAGA
jgi:hypothetical protein